MRLTPDADTNRQNTLGWRAIWVLTSYPWLLPIFVSLFMTSPMPLALFFFGGGRGAPSPARPGCPGGPRCPPLSSTSPHYSRKRLIQKALESKERPGLRLRQVPRDCRSGARGRPSAPAPRGPGGVLPTRAPLLLTTNGKLPGSSIQRAPRPGNVDAARGSTSDRPTIGRMPSC